MITTKQQIELLKEYFFDTDLIYAFRECRWKNIYTHVRLLENYNSNTNEKCYGDVITILYSDLLEADYEINMTPESIDDFYYEKNGIIPDITLHRKLLSTVELYFTAYKLIISGKMFAILDLYKKYGEQQHLIPHIRSIKNKIKLSIIILGRTDFR